MAASLGKQAVVIGAGIRRNLLPLAQSAIILKMSLSWSVDDSSQRAVPRAGTPQAQHTHALLGGGERALESLFPGFTAALREAGAVPYRMGLDILAPLVEYTVRQKLQERRNVTLRDRCRVTQLVTTDGNGGAVSAVRLAGSDGSGETLAADLVVDASEPRRAHARYAQGDKPSGPNGKHRWHRYVLCDKRLLNSRGCAASSERRLHLSSAAGR